jgi:hypothetical protein
MELWQYSSEHVNRTDAAHTVSYCKQIAIMVGEARQVYAQMM